MSQAGNAMVSVVVVCRNEEAYIAGCLDSICGQFKSPADFELVVVDGLSSDRTPALVDAWLAAHPEIRGCRCSNEKRTLAAGWNLGIRQASGGFVFRPDAHSVIHAGYVARALDVLQAKPEVAAVGGSLLTRTYGRWRDVIPAALSMKTGVGNSSFRTGHAGGYADTVVYAVYRKAVFDRVGLFDESLVRHQDTELHARMRRHGMRMWHDPSMTADYYCRNSPRTLYQQMFQIGYHLPALYRPPAPVAFRARHMAPFAFYLCLLVLLSLASFRYFAWAAVTLCALYLGAVFTETCYRLAVTRTWMLLHLLWLIPGMHLCYAAGTAAGWIRLLWCHHETKPH